MLLVIVGVLFLLFIIYVIYHSKHTPKEQLAKEYYSYVDPKKVFASRKDGKKWPVRSHNDGCGTLIPFKVDRVEDLENWETNRAFALLDYEPLRIVEGEGFECRLKTEDDKVLVGFVPESIERVVSNHLTSFVECYVTRVEYNEDFLMPDIYCEVFFSDIFNVPKQ